MKLARQTGGRYVITVSCSLQKCMNRVTLCLTIQQIADYVTQTERPLPWAGSLLRRTFLCAREDLDERLLQSIFQWRATKTPHIQQLTIETEQDT